MKHLEDELYRALRRIDPPPGFASRVIARAEQQAAVRPKNARLPSLWTRFRAWAGACSARGTVMGLAATAAVLVLAVSVATWRRHRIREEQRRGQIARAQVMEALRITSVKLHRVRTRVREATQDQGSSQDRNHNEQD